LWCREFYSDENMKFYKHLHYPGRDERFLSFLNVQTVYVAHPAPLLNTVVTSWEKSGRDVKLRTVLHIVPRLRMNGTIQLLPLYLVKVWTAHTLRCL
jgi:hypothetical protein